MVLIQKIIYQIEHLESTEIQNQEVETILQQMITPMMVQMAYLSASIACKSKRTCDPFGPFIFRAQVIQLHQDP